MQPWQELKKGQVDAERSILLDYLSPMHTTSLVQAVRHRHAPVVASISGFIILKAIILLSTGLLVLTPVESTGPHPVTLNTRFSKLPRTSLATLQQQYYTCCNLLQWPWLHNSPLSALLAPEIRTCARKRRHGAAYPWQDSSPRSMVVTSTSRRRHFPCEAGCKNRECAHHHFFGFVDCRSGRDQPAQHRGFTNEPGLDEQLCYSARPKRA